MKKITLLLVMVFYAIGYAQIPIYEFNFDGNVNNTGTGGIVTSLMTANVGNSFQYAANRAGVANSAIVIMSQNTGAVLPSLPSGAAQRTLAFWAKLNPVPTAPGFYSSTDLIGYGVFNNKTTFGFYTISNELTFYVGNSNDDFSLDITNSVNANGWIHMATTYDGSTTRTYINGVLVVTYAVSLFTNTIDSGYKLSFGKRGGENITGFSTNGLIDDLKIYNLALTNAQVTQLFNGTLSNSNFQTNNLTFSLYPNPATNLVIIDLETALKSVELYSLLGQKVLTSDKNQVDVSSLSKGMYMVRVEDVEGSVSTQKLVLK